MAIRFACPQCGKGFSVKDEYAGKRTKCPTCAGVVVVPAANVPAIVKPKTPVAECKREVVVPEIVEPPKPPAIIDVRAVAVVNEAECPFCGEVILAKAKKCKHCGEVIDVTLRAAQVKEAQPVAPVVVQAGGAASTASTKVVVRTGMGCFGCLGLLIGGGIIAVAVLIGLAIVGANAEKEFGDKAPQTQPVKK